MLNFQSRDDRKSEIQTVIRNPLLVSYEDTWDIVALFYLWAHTGVMDWPMFNSRPPSREIILVHESMGYRYRQISPRRPGEDIWILL